MPHCNYIVKEQNIEGGAPARTLTEARKIASIWAKQAVTQARRHWKQAALSRTGDRWEVTATRSSHSPRWTLIWIVPA